MNERLQQFLAAENITQAEFADKIKVGRPNVSHIISGRNKPSYDFVASVIKYYPELNIEWLITGKGKMYRSETQESSLFNFDDADAAMAESADTQDSPASEHGHVTREKVIVQVPVPAKQRSVTKVVIFFDDGTFQEWPK